MLNNLTNFWNIITTKMIKKVPEASDLISLGTRDSRYGGKYKSTAITVADFVNSIPIPTSGVQSVTGLNTNNTNPLNPIINIAVDGSSITGAGTLASPLQSLGSVWTDSNVIFVSPNGNDANPGTLQRPVASLYVGRNLASFGDLVYVLPGTWTFDNTSANGNPYNGVNQDLYLNLWKDGVNYYFSPGVKVTLLNQTVTGSPISLFRPIGTGNSTCNVYGALEIKCGSIGADSFNGHAMLFATDNTYAYQYTCFLEVHSMASSSSQVMDVARSAADASHVLSTLSIKANIISLAYTGGQSGAGAVVFFGETPKVLVKLDVDKITSTALGFYIRSTTDVIANINYSKCYYGDLVRAATSNKITINVKQCFYQANWYGAGGTAVLSVYQSAGVIMNLTGNYFDGNGGDGALFNFNQGSGNTLFLNANIVVSYTGVNSGRGIIIDVATNKTFFKGSILYNGTSAVTFVPFVTNTTGYMEITASLSGNFKGSVAYPVGAGSKIVFIGSRIDFSSTVGSQILVSTSPISGTMVFDNSTVFVNTTTDTVAAVGIYYIINSSIKNVGSGFDMFVNTTAGGSLTLLNSTLVNTDITKKTVNYVGTAPFTTANSATNTAATANVINGSVLALAAINIA